MKRTTQKFFKINSIVLIVCFGVCLLLPLIFTLKDNSSEDNTENRVLADFPVIKDSITGEFNHHFILDFEAWLNDNIGFRTPMNQLNSNIAYNIFNVSPHPMVLIRKDGWMFYMNDNNMDIAFNKYPLNDDDYDVLADAQLAIKDSLVKRGIDYFLLLNPSKVSIYPEKIHPLLKPIKTPCDLLYEKATALGVKVINTKESLLSKKDSCKLYQKTDPHWAGGGWYVAYRQLLDTLHAYGYAQNHVDTIIVKYQWRGDLVRLMKIPGTETCDLVHPANPQAKSQENIDALLAITDSLYTSNLFYWRNSCYITHKELPQKQKVLMFGDSFQGTLMNKLLCEHFSEFAFVWCDKFNLAVVDLIHPDLVIVERTERYVQTMNKSIDDRSCYLGNCP